jgi:hypothetical protein
MKQSSIAFFEIKDFLNTPAHGFGLGLNEDGLDPVIKGF